MYKWSKYVTIYTLVRLVMYNIKYSSKCIFCGVLPHVAISMKRNVNKIPKDLSLYAIQHGRVKVKKNDFKSEYFKI